MDLTPRPNLLSDPALTAVPATRLPDDPAAEHVPSSADRTELADLAARFPASSLAWALLARDALRDDSTAAAVMAYSYARTGYHRGLDALRRAGWRGAGPVPFDHEPNHGFLQALAYLALAADRIGEADEAQRCADFLYESSPEAFNELLAR